MMQNPHFVDELFSACSRRLQAEKPGAGTASAGGGSIATANRPPITASSSAPAIAPVQATNASVPGRAGGQDSSTVVVTDEPSAGSSTPSGGPAPKGRGKAQSSGAGQNSPGGTQGKSESIPCPNETVDTSLPVPALNAIEVETDPITGQLTNGTDATAKAGFPSGNVQLCDEGPLPEKDGATLPEKGGHTPLGKPVSASAKDGKFSVPASDGSLPRVTLKDEITAQFFTTTKDASGNSVNVYGPVSPAIMVGSCKTAGGSGSQPTFTGSSDSTGTVTYNGTVTNPASTDTVRICLDDLQQGVNIPITIDTTAKTGTYNGSIKAKPGNVVTAQVVSASNSSQAGSKATAQAASGSGTATLYGPVSEEYQAPTCSAAQSGDSSTRPTLNPLSAFSDSFSGTMPGAKPGTVVRLCVKDTPFATAVVKDNGTFIGSLPSSLHAAQWVAAQEITSAANTFPRKYGLLGPGQSVSGLAYSSLFSTFIAGVEQSGFSSEGSSTNAFLEAYLRSPYFPIGWERGLAVWGRIRLLGGPLPSGTSVIAAVTNPSGTITTSNLSNVGQVVDYVFGPELRLYQRDRSNGNTDRISLIGGVGATSPLSSSQIQYSLTAPTANSQGCFQLLNDSPYSYLFANGATAPGCSLVDKTTKNAINTLAFAPVDRSNFLIKYGAGFRLTHIYPAKNGQASYSGSLDFIVGQDQQITGGKFHGVVLGVNGVYPLALGSSSLLYLFGSASMKTTGNQNYPPLILGTAQTPTTPLATTVEVVPLTQPNRDFYRFGVGLNLTSVFCSLSKNGCNSNTGSGAGNNNRSTTNTGSATGTTTGTGSGTSGTTKKN